MRNRRRRGYKFTEKKHSRQGILATVLALALLVWYLVFLKLAFQGGGSLSDRPDALRNYKRTGRSHLQ